MRNRFAVYLFALMAAVSVMGTTALSFGQPQRAAVPSELVGRWSKTNNVTIMLSLEADGRYWKAAAFGSTMVVEVGLATVRGAILTLRPTGCSVEAPNGRHACNSQPMMSSSEYRFARGYVGELLLLFGGSQWKREP